MTFIEHKQHQVLTIEQKLTLRPKVTVRVLYMRIPARMPMEMPTCMPARIPTCMPACLPVRMPAWRDVACPMYVHTAQNYKPHMMVIIPAVSP